MKSHTTTLVRGSSCAGLRQAQALCDVEEDVRSAVHTTEGHLARTTGEDRNVGKGMHTLAVVDRDGTVREDALLLGIL